MQTAVYSKIVLMLVCFPSAVGMASSFHPDALAKLGETLGEECQAEDVSILLGPGVNMKRSPLCGRNFEYFSEDPYLTGKLAASYVRGVQSKGRRHQRQAFRGEQSGVSSHVDFCGGRRTRTA